MNKEGNRFVKLKDCIGKEIQPLDEAAMEQARKRMAQLTMPPGSLGRLGDIAVQLSGIRGEMPPVLGRRPLW